VTNLLASHGDIQRHSPGLSAANWSNTVSFTFTRSGLETNPSVLLTNPVGNSASQSWRILVP
jgi:hypothetical protein